ncbi:uncharacterized protein [Ptychodera flava]|uniref:uncharacterized protein n=1 Tax=Ptychodera flava TaxID=63121 RepID=UPI00396AA871
MKSRKIITVAIFVVVVFVIRSLLRLVPSRLPGSCVIDKIKIVEREKQCLCPDRNKGKPDEGSVTGCLEDNENFFIDRYHKMSADFVKYLDDITNYHLNIGVQFRRSEGFLKEAAFLFESWGYSQGSFRDQIVVDVGAGSRMRGVYFEKAKLVAVGPVISNLMYLLPNANQSRTSHMDFNDKKVVWKVFPQFAEVRACSIEGKAALVYSINFLDHLTFEPEAAFENMARMLLPCGHNASMVISADLDGGNGGQFQHTLSDDWMVQMAQRCRLLVVKATPQTMYNSKDAYKRGKAYTYIFRRKC